MLKLVQQALEATPDAWPGLVQAFQKETDATYGRARQEESPGWWKKWLDDPRAQYDRHAQVIFRIFDQNRRPISHFDIFFDSRQKDAEARPIQTLFEDKHLNEISPNVISFYLRTDAFRADANDWVPQVPEVKDCGLEITAVEPQTDDIIYLPFRLELSSERLAKWVQGHRTTIMDVELLRLPSPTVFKIV